MGVLSGKKALVIGIANENSIAYGCAKAFADAGADLGVSYLNARAEPHVRPLADGLKASLILPLDVREPGQLEAMFDHVAAQWGGLDVLVHSIAYCPREDLHGRVVDCSREGFLTAMDISVHSFMRMVKLSEPLMAKGGCCMTVTFYGSEKVVEHYNVMGPVKAALEAVTRYMAAELGGRGIRVHALSPGPLQTRAASGIDRFDELMARAAERAPIEQLVTIEDVGAYAVFLAGDGAKRVTGGIHMIDGGYSIVG